MDNDDLIGRILDNQRNPHDNDNNNNEIGGFFVAGGGCDLNTAYSEKTNYNIYNFIDYDKLPLYKLITEKLNKFNIDIDHIDIIKSIENDDNEVPDCKINKLKKLKEYLININEFEESKETDNLKSDTNDFEAGILINELIDDELDKNLDDNLLKKELIEYYYKKYQILNDIEYKNNKLPFEQINIEQNEKNQDELENKFQNELKNRRYNNIDNYEKSSNEDDKINEKLFDIKYNIKRLILSIDNLIEDYEIINDYNKIKEIVGILKTKIGTNLDSYCINVEKVNKLKNMIENINKLSEHFSVVNKELLEITNKNETEELESKVSKEILTLVDKIDISKIKEELYTVVKNFNYYKKICSLITDLSEYPVCQTCISSYVDTVLIPCGHTSCEKCLTKVTNKKCFTCQVEYEKTVKLHF